jgi:hypothetical protein
MEAFCKTCDSVQPVERVEEGSESVFCESCGDEFVLEGKGPGETERYHLFVVASVLSVEVIPKQKELKKVRRAPVIPQTHTNLPLSHVTPPLTPSLPHLLLDRH